MKKIFFIFLFILPVLSSFGQQKSDDLVVMLYFIPSYSSRSTLVIETKGDSASVKIQIKNHPAKGKFTEDKANFPANKLTTLISFLNTHKLPIKDSSKTVHSHTNAMIISGDSVLSRGTPMIFDGIIFYGSFIQDDIKYGIVIDFLNQGKTETKLASIIFDLLNSAFTNQSTLDYIENLEQEFRDLLRLKKLSDNPLTYKLFGFIPFGAEDDLYNFLKNLPANEKVIIDMSNYNKMLGLPAHQSDEFGVKGKDVYWLNPTDQGLIDLHLMGIRKERVITKKKLIIEINGIGKEVFTVKDK